MNNRDFIAAHRARQAAAPSPIYWALPLVAEACGVSEHDLHYRYRPDFWGVPRDWNVVKGITLYCDEALPSLAQNLAEHGLTEAAAKLHAWWQAQRLPSQLTAGSGGTVPDTKGLGLAPTPAAPAQESQPWFREGQFE